VHRALHRAGVRPDDLARAVEERGFESLFYTEHTHIPVASRRREDGLARLDTLVAVRDAVG
jgi:alkanesulfonate monooxygenase SsuD/methylene tetrahydromethanopterin reductase-like flavin-dependent oxidoreductase (luciferase family)